MKNITTVAHQAPWEVPDETVTVGDAGARHQFRWGRWDAFGTAAHWAWRADTGDYGERVDRHVATTTLVDELVFTLLGGFGIKAEVAHAAQSALARAGVLQPGTDPSAVEAALRVPLPTGRDDRTVKYRFPAQRATRIAAAVDRLAVEAAPSDALALRSWLETFQGVGPKTSAWVVRNVTGSDDVAIIDIWVARACRRAGVFDRTWRPERDYDRMERAFVEYAGAAAVRTSVLDLCIWEQARLHPRLLAAA